MYESPIQMISEDIIKDIVEKQNGYLIEIVHRLGFDVNEEEIKKALTYDRYQYEKGYADGRTDRDAEVVRCRECKWWKTLANNRLGIHICQRLISGMRGEDFCSRGERKDDADDIPMEYFENGGI